MSFRQIFQRFFKRAGPIMCSTNFMFPSPTETKQPTENDKLKFEPIDTKKLTDEYLIQQSTVDAVNSATQALTVSYSAIMRASNEYKTLLNDLIVLSKETMQFNVSDTHWDMILELRCKAQTKKQSLDSLTGYVEYIHKMAIAVSEMSYLSGLDNMSLTLCQRIDDALKNIQEEVKSVTTLEQEYYSVQEQCIRHESKLSSENEPVD